MFHNGLKLKLPNWNKLLAGWPNGDLQGIFLENGD